MTTAEQFDAIIIGAGQAGVPLSRALAESGRHTALVERAHVGGTCVNEGCTPTKTMVASARVAYLARRGADYGVCTGPISVDMARVRQRKREIVVSFRSGAQHRIESTKGDELIFGEARFIGPKIIEVKLNDGGTRTLRAENIFINAGTRAARPDLPGLDSTPALDNASIMELDTLPEHLLVLGGGYIGLEFGQMFRRFGSRVTVVHRGDHLLAREDDDVAGEVEKILREDGLEILLNAKTKTVARSGSSIQLTVQTPEGERTLISSHLLVATGRTPNTDKLNLAATGLATDARGFLPANDRLETAVPGIFALGDIKGGPAFTHISYDDFRIIRTNLIEGGNASTKGRLVPYTVFIDPQLGRIGLTENEARTAKIPYKLAKMPMNYVARALEMDETRGFMKALIDPASGKILGAAVLGVEGGELCTQLQLAMMGGLPYTTLRDAVFSHPTLAESLNNLFTGI